MSTETSQTSWGNHFGIRKQLSTAAGTVDYYSLPELEKKGLVQLDSLPYSIRVLIEAIVRQHDNFIIDENDVKSACSWQAGQLPSVEIPFKPARVVMQDFTGVPGVVDLAAMRDALRGLGVNPSKINPALPVDLVIDHSVQVDSAGSTQAQLKNIELEFERNAERYEFLRWGSESFENFRVVPPAMGIVHQVNLEYLARVVMTRKQGDTLIAYPDSLVGTDSHTTMINGLGVVGWGVGGIEAEAVMLEQPVYMLLPEVVGFELTGELPQGATATDLVLTITEMLRAHGVVGKFVEFFGPGLDQISLADRATIANMAPEYGATMGFFPVDSETIRYMKLTGREDSLADLVERYLKEQGMFRTPGSSSPNFTSQLSLDMSTVIPSISGPKRPQDRIPLNDSKVAFNKTLKETFDHDTVHSGSTEINGQQVQIEDGSIVIAAITSCTNTSNPSVMLGAGLLARNAIEKGLMVKPHVKTSLAPGSRAVSGYLKESGLDQFLDQLGFHTVGYGCTTCIGNSGPIEANLSSAINENKLVAAAVLSGNRNFEGRIHADVRANYLASPPLVVAYAIAGTMNIDLEAEPLGVGKDGNPVYLKDIWPSLDEVKETVNSVLSPEIFRSEYATIFEGNEDWKRISIEKGELYQWSQSSTYIRKPTFFEGITLEKPGIPQLENMQVLAFLGDSVTTDHISPAGAIKEDSPAGRWLNENGVKKRDFNTYGSRRGNHEIMMRGTFANIRIRNKLVPGVEGGETKYIPSGEQMAIYDAAEKYKAESRKLIILAGKEYGTGSSRDWAAKGTALLGVGAVIAESFERIHRSNLIGMGIIPLQFKDGESAESLGITGEELFSIEGLDNNVNPRQILSLTATLGEAKKKFEAHLRADTPVEVEYLRNGGILHTVLRNMGKA
jgi:aconitate hydratase